jgi:glutamyl/glutaminyl-tRNA synthetase
MHARIARFRAAPARLARLSGVASAHQKPAAPYRGRIAPSPTGYLHAGHARTFWTAFARARAAGGTLVMRMEDLDRERSRDVYAQAALEDLRWLGIEWQEGPDVGGPFAPHTQSERGALYRAAWRRLVEGGFLFPCRCSRKDLENAAAAPHEADAADDEPLYPGTCRTPLPLHGVNFWTSDEAVKDGVNWRFRVPNGEAIEFVDGNLGPQRFVAGVDFGDFLVWRRDGPSGSSRTGLRPWGGGSPSYQLACVVDDSAMQITEVVRGADLLKSTARQILLNRALGYPDPAWFHCALVVDRSGRRLAKRHDALSLRTLRQRGLTPADVLSGALPEEP